ncbi:unnamed protein product [Calypogeia fissa]
MACLLLAPATSLRSLSVGHATAPFHCIRETSKNCGRLSQVSPLCIRCQNSSKKGTTSSQKNIKRNGREGWILDNAGAIRRAPLFAGAASLGAVLLNRFFSGIAAVADASSVQSRADVLAVALAAVVVLTGLVWKSIEPRPQFPVVLDGVECLKVASGLPVDAARELNWAWEALAEATNTAALVVVYGKTCVLQCGVAAESSDGTPVPVDVVTLLEGSLFKTVQTSETQMYLANLALYPSRFELPFLPSNTQAVIIQPLGNDGIMIVASDTLRGFGPSDQGWIVAIGEKLDSTLTDAMSSRDRDLVSGSESKGKPIETTPSR